MKPRIGRTVMGMIFLEVPYPEKDSAKALGAKWYSSKKKWYIHDDIDTKPFSRWMPAESPIQAKTEKIEALEGSARRNNINVASSAATL